MESSFSFFAGCREAGIRLFPDSDSASSTPNTLYRFRRIVNVLSVYPPLMRGSKQAVFRLLACAILLMLTLCRAQAQATGSISGTILLDGISKSIDAAKSPAQPITFEFTNTSGNVAPFVRTVMVKDYKSMTNGFDYQFSNIPVGSYCVGVKGPKWLQAILPDSGSSIVVTSGNATTLNVSLNGGDANNDNHTDVLDFGLLVNSYGRSLGDSDYDPTADFDCNGMVDVLDFGILVNNYGGDGVPYTINLTASHTDYSGQIVLTWNLRSAATGQPITTSQTTAFKIYCSATPAYDGVLPPIPFTASPNTTTMLVGLPVTTAGPHYYQIVAAVPDTADFPGGCAFSKQVVVSIPNPFIEDLGNSVFRVTDFQSNNTTINYQAVISGGLLTYFAVYNPQTGNKDTLLNDEQNSANITGPAFRFSQGNDYYALGAGMPAGYTLTSAISNYTTITTNFHNGGYSGTAAYVATPTGLQITLDANDATSVNLRFGTAVSAVQDSADGGQGIYRLPGTGLTHSLPIPCYSNFAYDPTHTNRYGFLGTRNLHCLFGAGSADFTYALNDGKLPFNDGELFSYCQGSGGPVALPYTSWGRSFGASSDSNGAYRAYVQFTLNAAGSTTFVPNTTPPFHLVLEDNDGSSGSGSHNGYGMYAADSSNFVYCQLQIDPGNVGRGTFIFNYAYTDFWGNPVTGTNLPITIPVTMFVPQPNTSAPVYKYAPLKLNLPKDASGAILSGYFFLKGSLTPVAPANVLPNEDGTEFGVYHVMNKQPYLYDIPLPSGQIQKPGYYAGQVVDPFNPISSGGNIGASDPAGPRILGMRAVRIAKTLVDKRNETATEQPFPPSSAALSVSKLYDLLSTYSNTGLDYANGTISSQPIDPNDTVLIGSIDTQGASQPGDVFDMVSSLTYVPPTHTTGGLAANPIKYWSLDNEPNPTDMGKYVQDILKKSSQKVQDAYHDPSQTFVADSTPVNPPIVMGPNFVQVEQTYNGGDALSAWDAFFSTTYNVVGDPTTHYAAELLDAFSTHDYTGAQRPDEEHGLYEDLLSLQAKIAGAPNGSGLKPGTTTPKDLWITESGREWRHSPDMPRLQADYIVRDYALCAAAGIPHEHNAYYYTEQCNADFTFYLWDRKPNRGGMAMRILNEKTAGMSYDAAETATLHAGKYVHAVPYTDRSSSNPNKAETIVLWGEDFTDPQRLSDPQTAVRVTFYSDKNDVMVYDIMGNPLTVLSSGNAADGYTYRIPATGSPVYIVCSHSDHVSIGGSGWPALAGETNYAKAANVTASSSPCVPAGLVDFFPGVYPYAPFNSGGVPAINNGFWQYDEGETRGKTVWISQQTYPLPTPGNRNIASAPFLLGDYVMLTFPAAQTIDTLVAAVPSSNNLGKGTTCGVRDYEFDISTDGVNWQTVKTVTGNRTERILYAVFPAQPIKAARFVIGAINNGRWYDDFTVYKLHNNPVNSKDDIIFSPARAMVYEFEAYGRITN